MKLVMTLKSSVRSSSSSWEGHQFRRDTVVLIRLNKIKQ